ncbi:hypothetical protein OPS25_01375 [Alteromonas ponticola]|uniref:Roadblock/LAMTOR2 domain-containing protein n=1 Tax=Alteromonas aquimaris TaxID=2998417 RepID=A0ABT3P328_9ALTE|nr:hypothetical protein [Alteromonas aquimaris]MCW8107153.1 hypothetical protein [Alteromonas aquimaris]
METESESTQENLVRQICTPLVGEALAVCVVTSDGKIAFGFGDKCDFSDDATDAAMIFELIGKLTELKKQRACE